MTVHNLDALFKPDSIALICSGNDSDVIIARNLMNGGFRGPVMPVDTTRPALEGARTYPAIASLPLTPELAVITSPLREVPALLSQLSERGTRAAVLVSEARGHHADEREALQQAILDAAKPHLLRVLGPGCLGLSVPLSGLNASLSQFRPLTGQVAFVTQSSAIAQTALDWGSSHQHFGFSYLINVGAALDVDFADVLDYLTTDYRTRAILLYLEHIHDARQFMSAARRAARIKPVIVLKPRRHREDAVDDAVYSAAFRRAGILRVDDHHELFNLVEALTAAKLVRNDRLAILSNSYSLGVLATDTLYHLGGRLAQFSEVTQEGLETLTDPLGFSINPVDLGDQADAGAYGQALDLLLQDPGVDGILVIKAPSALSDAPPVAEAVVQRLPGIRRCLLASFPGSHTGEAARRRLMEHQVPTYETCDGAVRAFMRMVQYKRNQQLLMETPPSLPEEFTPHTERARHIIAQALADGRERLNEFEAMQLLAAYGIPVVDTHVAESPVRAAEIAGQLNRPVALKILSPAIENKSQIGGVARYLNTPEAVRQAAEAMQIRLHTMAPAAPTEGFLIQPIEYRDGAYEMTLGVRSGGHFGPVIYFGQGGTEAKVINDIAYGLPPLNMHLAREIMSQTRIFQLLRYSLLRRADLNALALTLIKISQMVIDLGELVELDINPLRASAHGVLVLDARIRIAPCADEPTQRLAIRPYPKELEERCTLADERQLLLRPVLPEDEPALHALVQRASPEDLRRRFLQPIRELSHDMAARLTQIDYNREMALVAVGPGVPGKAEVFGLVSLSADPDNDKAEYSIIVDHDSMRLGLGSLLMRRILAYARARGIREVYGEVLQENEPMLQLNKALGFTIKITPDDPALRHVTLRL
jgi:acetyltransferase